MSCVKTISTTRGNSRDEPPHVSPDDHRQATLKNAPRVLVIDDDPEFAHALKLRFESYGIEVLCATTGLDAYCYAVGERADVILLDYQLPNGCGDYVLEQLKANPTTKDIPVIIVSGSKDRALELTMVNDGAVKFMHKPLEFKELMTELRKYLPSSTCRSGSGTSYSASLVQEAAYEDSRERPTGV